MLHHETPDRNGWYWVLSDDTGDCMAYFHAEKTPRRIDLFFADEDLDRPLVSYQESDDGLWQPREEAGGRPWSGPSRWVGPLSTPFGPFQGEIAEFCEALLDRAEEQQAAAVMLHVNYQNCTPPFGSVTCVKLMPMEDANMAMVKVFGGLGTDA